MKKQSNMTPPKVHNSSIAQSKDIKMLEMSNKEFKSLVSEMTNALKQNSNKQMNEIKKSI
jgi:hypothetical protein